MRSQTSPNTFLLLLALFLKVRVSGTRGLKSISRSLNRSFLVPGSTRSVERAFFWRDKPHEAVLRTSISSRVSAARIWPEQLRRPHGYRHRFAASPRRWCGGGANGREHGSNPSSHHESTRALRGPGAFAR